jgi:type IV pilus assembly protein PilM
VFQFPRKHRPLLGLDITTSSIKLIELSVARGQYRVESYAAEPTPHNAINEKSIVDADTVGEAISRAVKRSGATSKEAAIAISGDAVITKLIQMPRGLKESELEAQVELQAEPLGHGQRDRGPGGHRIHQLCLGNAHQHCAQGHR